MNVKPLVAPLARVTGAWSGAASALWTFPAMLASAFLVAWGAEAAQFLISQGLALAALAWIQTLPEAAVEVVIAWQAGRDPARAHLAVANLTGAIRLLVGVGMPMVFFVAAAHRETRRFAPITLDREHSVEVMALIPPLLWFAVIWWKRTLTVVDAGVLIAAYAAYLWALWHHPPHEAEQLSQAPRVARWAYGLGGRRRAAAIAGLFAAGGVLLYVTAEPFLESMLAVAGALGVSQFVFVQWVAPFLSEFPEKVSAFGWARRVTHAPMAMMNMASSNINQWTVLASMIPLVYGWSHLRAHGTWAAFAFDGEQQAEIALTIAQSLLVALLLMDLRFGWLDATGLFLLWLAQFARPALREAVTVLYLVWCLALVVLAMLGRRSFAAGRAFVDVWRENRMRRKAG